MFQDYDIIVVGAGHAGCEAAAVAANLGSRVLLITMNMQTIAQMSCNPAMGGIAKGQIVREIDALGGYSGIVSDKSAIQFRMLNRSKGPAMWSPRTQNDRQLFADTWRQMLESTKGLDFWMDMVSGLLLSEDKKRVVGVKTGMGIEFKSKAVVLTNGTFLNGIIHIGEKQLGGGRSGEKAATGITEQLIGLGFVSGRMKTGTPPRLDGRTIDYTRTEIQEGDSAPEKFSYSSATSPLVKQKPCYITYTNEEVHDILKDGFDKSPMFQGRIQGLGPRYCPSIEDKINRFSERTRHQLFIEPEGWNTIEIYLNGFSTSLPEETQYKALQKIPGLENVKMFRPGYAIEYDYFPPTQLKLSLETHLLEGLFFAGQINGTTGYEEAACQGLMAGINAHQKINNNESFVLSRDEAYIGVLIDDLINKGTEEPYRMFTSRAEYRLLLRQDNADLRLTERASKLGHISLDRLNAVKEKSRSSAEVISFFKSNSADPANVNVHFRNIGTSEISQKIRYSNLITRPQLGYEDFIKCSEDVKELYERCGKDAFIQAEILLKYEGYIEREKEMASKMRRLDDFTFFEDFDYSRVNNLSLEAREKLRKQRPRTLGQASRISGISPADISVLMVYLGK